MALAVCLGCIDPAAERTRRDFEESGRADLGDVEARIDPGIVLPWEGEPAKPRAVRFRANAPTVRLTLRSRAGEARAVSVRIDNLPPEAQLPLAATEVRREGKSARFVLRLAAGESLDEQISPPDSALPQRFRFAWVGDVQGGVGRFGLVREAINGDPAIDFVLFSGDVTASGTDEEMAEFSDAADRLERPWYALIGNHDTGIAREDAFPKRIGRLNFGFDHKGARFLLLDTASATLDQRAWDFASSSLSGEEPRLRLVGMHVPPIDFQGLRDAGFASRAEGAKLVQMLAERGVDLLLAGHLHTLRYASFGGVRAIVSGNGGVGAEDKLDDVGLHYLAVDADPEAERFDVSAVELE
ncbi:MAG: metallophosphoesterase [Myxococcales bacterium]